MEEEIGRKIKIEYESDATTDEEVDERYVVKLKLSDDSGAAPHGVDIIPDTSDANESLEGKSNEEYSSFVETPTQDASVQCELSVNEGREQIMATARLAYELPPINLDHDDLEEQFRRYKWVFEKIMIALNVKPEEKAKRAALFISELPNEARLILADYDFVAKGKSDENIEDITKAIVETKKKATSQIMARHRLANRTMREGEKFEDYLKALKSLASLCGYESQKDSILRDRTIQGHRNSKLMIDILNMGDTMTLEKVVDLCKKDEDSREAAGEFLAHAKHEADAVRTKFGGQQGKTKKNEQKKPPKTNSGKKNEEPRLCKFCGTKHVWGADNCPAYGRNCATCGRKNHAAKVCREAKQEKKHAHAIEDQSGEENLTDGSDYEAGDAVNEAHSDDDQQYKSDDDDEILRTSSSPKPKLRSEVVVPKKKSPSSPEQHKPSTSKTPFPPKQQKPTASKKVVADLRRKLNVKAGKTEDPRNQNKVKTGIVRPAPRNPEETPLVAGTSRAYVYSSFNEDEQLDYEPDDDDDDIMREANALVSTVIPKSWHERVAVDGRTLTMKIDSGCSTNIVSLKQFQKIGLDEKKIKPTRTRLITYSKNTMHPVGEFTGVLAMRRKKVKAKFLVIREEREPLLGCPTGTELGLFRFDRASILHSPTNEGLDACEDILPPCSKKVTIRVDPKARPVNIPARRVPLAIKDQLYQELMRMQRMGVIAPVNEPRPWCHAMVVGHKPNGKLRVCIDPRTINPHIAH